MGALMQTNNVFPTAQEAIADKLAEITKEVYTLSLLGARIDLHIAGTFVLLTLYAPTKALGHVQLLSDSGPESFTSRNDDDHISAPFFTESVLLDGEALDHPVCLILDSWLSQLCIIELNISTFSVKTTPQTSDLFHQAGA